MTKELEKLLKMNEAAELLNVAPQTLWKWVRSGDGPSAIQTPTGLYLFEPSDVASWLNGLKTGTHPKVERTKVI